jgi:folate-binding protein YgfZ
MAMKIFNPDRQLYREARTGTVFVRLERGLLKATGADRLDLLHRLSTNATRDLAAGQETSTILTSDKGRVVEVVRVIVFEDHVLLLLANSDVEPARAFLDKYTIMDDFIAEDVSREYGVLGLYGAGARSIVSALMDGEPPNAGAFSHVALDGGRIIVLRDARLNGTSGFLLLASATLVDSLAEQLSNAGVVEIDDATYQTLRIESGLPAPGYELSEQYNPLEAGLATMINWTKGCYIGQEVIARLDTYDKVQRHLVGLRFQGEVAGNGDAAVELMNEEGKKVGVVTSATFSPSLEETIALAYVRTQHAIPGATLDAVTSGDEAKRLAQAIITRLPFDL